MNVLALTIFVSAVLAGTFLLFWFIAVMAPHAFSDREALLPLEDDTSSASPSSQDKTS